MISGIGAADIKPDDGNVDRFLTVWNRFDEWTQLRCMADVVNQAIFDPDDGTLEVTLAADAVDRIEAIDN